MWYKEGMDKVRFYEVKSEYQEILNFVVTCNDIKKKICAGCPVSMLYDKNGKYYAINRQSKLVDVKKMIEEIRKINSEC